MSAAQFVREDRSCELPRVPATVGSDGYDVSKLLASTGDVTLDYGFGNTASCRSAITYIDGDAGILRYRGYPIEQLAEHSTFLETSYLVLYGELPTASELEAFTQAISGHYLLTNDSRRCSGCSHAGPTRCRCWPRGSTRSPPSRCRRWHSPSARSNSMPTG